MALVGISLPTFFFATLLKLFFSVKLGWFDLYGLVGRDYAQLDSMGQFLDKANHLVLPIVTLVIVSIGGYMRYTRTNMLEVLNADYIRTARAKGVPERTVIWKHVLKNALLPVVTQARSCPAARIVFKISISAVFGRTASRKSLYSAFFRSCTRSTSAALGAPPISGGRNRV